MASRYAVEATFTANPTAGTKWSATDGGAGGASAPASGDDVFLTALTPVGTITLSTITYRSFTCTGYLGTVSHPAATTLSLGDGTAGAGSVALLLVAGMTYTLGNAATSALSFVSTSATQQTIATGGKVLGNWTVNGAGSSYLLSDANTVGATATVTLTSGTLNTNGQACSWGLFAGSGSTTRALTLGASAITLTGTGTVWTFATSTGLTFTANTSTITCNGATVTFNGGAVTFNTLSLTGSGVATLGGGTTYANVTRTGTAVKTDGLTFSAAFTVTGTLTITGNSAVNRILAQSSTVGTSRTITAAAVVLSNVAFMDITGAGLAANAPWTGTNLGDALGNSNITFDTPLTLYRVGAGGNWSDSNWSLTSGGLTAGIRVPLPQDTVNVDANASGTITADMPRLGKDLIFTGFAGTLAVNSTANTIYGSLTLVSGLTLTSTQAFTFAGRGSHTITSAGKSFGGAITLQAPSGTYTLQDAFATTSTLTHSDGTFVDGGFTVTSTTFISTSGRTRTLTRTGAWTVTSAAATTVWSVSATGLSMTNTGASVTISVASTNSRTFAGGGFTYGTLTYTVATSPGPLVITGANTFTAVNVGPGRTLTMPSSATTNVSTAVGWNVSGIPNGYLYLPGVIGHYSSSPDSVATSITGDIDVRVRLAPNSWSPFGGYFTKYGAGGHSWLFSNNGVSSTLRFYYSLDGTSDLQYNSSTTHSLADATVAWIRFTRVAATGVGTFYTSTTSTNNPNSVSWTPLGTALSGTAGSLFDSTSPIEVGTYFTGAAPTPGKFYRGTIYSTIGGSTPVFDADFTTKTLGANSFAESSSNAATVTINGTLAQDGDGRITVNYSTPTTAGTLSIPTGVVVSDYIVLRDSSASGSTPFYAGANSVNVSNNTLWNFTIPTYPISVSETGTGTDTFSSLLASITGSETGLGADTFSALVGTITGSETGTGTDIGITIGQSETETGTGIDTGSLLGSLVGSETGTAVDTALSLLGSLSGAETGTGVDTGVVVGTVTGTETGTGVDVGSLLGILSASETGTGVDTFLSLVAAIAASDSGTGVDLAGAITAILSGSDSGTGVDSGTVLASIFDSDSGTGEDDGTLVGIISALESAEGLDEVLSLTAELLASDSGTGVDTGALIVLVDASDEGTGTEGPVIIAMSGSDSGTGTEGFPLISVFASDSGHGVDAGTVVVFVILSMSIIQRIFVARVRQRITIGPAVLEVNVTP